MKIISLNLHCLKEENLLEKLERVANFINENDIDVCLFQEVAQLNDNKILFDNVKEGNNCYLLWKMLKEKYHFYFEAKKLGFSIYEEGLAILSKKPLANKGYAYISYAKEFSNWLTRITVFGDYDDISFYNIHLGWTIGDETIEHQIDELSNMALKHSNPVMIFGDYNCCYKSKEYQYFLDKGFYSVSELLNIDIDNNPTFNFPLDNGQTDNRVIDHIFINKKMKIIDYRVLFRDNPVSDHNMIYLEIE